MPQSTLRNKAAGLSIAMACLSACTQPADTLAEQTQPHTVVFISLDTVRPDFLSAYGHPWSKTPVMDALADEGLLFEDAISPAPTTLAAHSSMFTSTYPHRHGVPRNGFYLADENLTLPEILSEAGYHAVGFVAAFPLKARFNLAQGFHYYDDDLADSIRTDLNSTRQRSAEAVNASIENFLQAYDNSDPLFLFVHYFDAHAPNLPPKPMLEQYSDVPYVQPKTEHNLEKRFNRLVESNNLDKMPELVHRYAAEIAYVDQQLGVLFNRLKEAGRYDNALIILTSDHGEEHWDHEPYFDHGRGVYHSVVQALGIVKLPQNEYAGNRISTPVSTLDWLPSILGYLGLDIPADIDGIDLNLTEGVNAPKERVLFSEATKPHWAEREDDPWPNSPKSRAAYQEGLKLIRTPFRKSTELYDRYNDPNELDDLAGLDHINAQQDLLHHLQEWEGDMRTLTVSEPDDGREEIREALESLGYLD